MGLMTRINHQLLVARRMSSNPQNAVPNKPSEPKPGEGIRSLQSTTLFRAVNFELYAKPNIVVMGLGLACFGGVLSYIAYMRYKYESQGYYGAVQSDGSEVYTKRLSKWD